jgi:hypothetical protein
MKRLVLILMVVVFFASVLISCSKNICPAYTYNDTAEQTEVLN